MGILGVLLGITISVLAGAIWFVRIEHRVYTKAVSELEDRVAVLERRKAFSPDATQALNKSSEPTKVAAYRPRTWNEDTAQAEVKNG